MCRTPQPRNRCSCLLKSRWLQCRYLLGCGSVPVLVPSEFEEFWYHLLQHGENAVVLDFPDDTDPAQYLADEVHYLRDHDAEARAIAKGARRVIQRDLSPEVSVCGGAGASPKMGFNQCAGNRVCS